MDRHEPLYSLQEILVERLTFQKPSSKPSWTQHPHDCMNNAWISQCIPKLNSASKHCHPEGFGQTMLRTKALPLLQTQIAGYPLVARRVHQLASIKHVCALPERRRQALLHPFNSLGEHLSSQVSQEEFKIFYPCLEELRQAETLFTPSKHSIDYSASAVRLDHVPLLKQPEVR